MPVFRPLSIFLLQLLKLIYILILKSSMYGFDVILAGSCIVTIAIEISGAHLASLFYFLIL